MYFQEYVNSKNEFNGSLLTFIDNEQENQDDFLFESLTQMYDLNEIGKSRDELKILLHMISKISRNHHRKDNFFDKIEKIIEYIKNDIKQTLSNFDIFTIFEDCNRILVYLFEKSILVLDLNIYKYFISNFFNVNSYQYYLENFVGKQKLFYF